MRIERDEGNDRREERTAEHIKGRNEAKREDKNKTGGERVFSSSSLYFSLLFLLIQIQWFIFLMFSQY